MTPHIGSSTKQPADDPLIRCRSLCRQTEPPLDNWPTVLFQRQHFEEMARRLETKGYQVAPLDFDVGSNPMDRFIDMPPYVWDWRFGQAKTWATDGTPHLKLSVDGFLSTCFGIIALKR